jgi:transcriptional regulator with GAF, ATPase, and Fis domain
MVRESCAVQIERDAATAPSSPLPPRGVGIVGESAALQKVIGQIETVARTEATVLILGETGTGKELVAGAIHERSQRRQAPFVALNCAAIAPGLLESELFGHEKGAFTGAHARRVGRFEHANQGTIFLDEIGEMALEVQPRLLRLLQEREFERLGSNRTVHVDARVIAATNRSLLQMCVERKFREDLYYRLNVFPIALPSLRERREDIPLLVAHFVERFCLRMKKSLPRISRQTMALLEMYDWPGNVRELQNVLERAVILSDDGELHISLPRACAPRPTLEASQRTLGPAAQTLAEVDREHILSVMRSVNGVVAGPHGAAVRLGLKRSTLIFRLKKLGIRGPGDAAVRPRAT